MSSNDSIYTPLVGVQNSYVQSSIHPFRTSSTEHDYNFSDDKYINNIHDDDDFYRILPTSQTSTPSSFINCEPNSSTNTSSIPSSTTTTTTTTNTTTRTTTAAGLILENDPDFANVEFITSSKFSLIYRAFSNKYNSHVIIKMHKFEFPSSKSKHKFMKEFQVGQQFFAANLGQNNNSSSNKNITTPITTTTTGGSNTPTNTCLNGTTSTATIFDQSTTDKPYFLSHHQSNHHGCQQQQQRSYNNGHDHDYIVEYYEMRQYGRRLALVMQDFNGLPLCHALGEPWTVHQFLTYAIQMVEGLSVIHRNSIVHQNITPRHILLNLNTRTVKFIDFGLCSTLNKQYQTVINPKNFEHYLEYISPEQTGIHKDLDYRTDFYSLGVVFYEMLTGAVPFSSNDSLKLIYSHIAKSPTAPNEINSSIPQVISDIIIKLLEKNADDRYQSCYGLKMDLKMCLELWDEEKQVMAIDSSFTSICQYDVHSTFHIYQKLYGREGDIALLLEAFDEVASGAVSSNLLLVSGYSGIGKTSLINEVQKPLVRDRGYFCSGKFDQFKRNIPYSSIIEAFQQLILTLLTESEARIQYWRDSLLKTLSSHGKVITDVIPEVEMIIGPQPSVPELGPSENQNRFKRVFADFFGVFVSKEHPLILFLDDLQWADLPTLSLLESILGGNIEYLFIIGAYRDNEVHETHPLSLFLKRLEKRRASFRNISLKPLELTHITCLISDTLNCSLERSKELAQLVLQKTAGNPFFTTMFLTNLARDNLVVFDPVDGQWKWDIREIYGKNITDNVVQMMSSRIQQLGRETQTILSLAASIGNKFDLNVLSVIYQKDIQTTARDLWPAVKDCLVLQFGEETLPSLSHDTELFDGNIVFAWMHDRVQQAAYELVDNDARKRLHLNIGRLLLQNIPKEQQDENLFDILSHFKVAAELVTDPIEREQLARLFLKASSRAKDSSAFDPACEYAITGVSLLPDNDWEESYELAFLLHKQRAECEYLRGNFEYAESMYPIIIGHCKSLGDVVETNQIQIKQYEIQQRYLEIFEVVKNTLTNFQIYIPFEEAAVRSSLQKELEEVEINLAGRRIEDLIHAPEMVDPEHIQVFKLLSLLFSPVYCMGYSNSDLLSLISAKMCNFALQHGNCNLSSSAYINYSFIAGFCTGDYEKAYKFGRLGLDLMEIYPNEPQRCRSYFIFATGTNNWTRPLSEAIPYIDRCMELSIEHGDSPYTTYSCHHMVVHRYLNGESLATLQKMHDQNMPFLRKTNSFIYSYALGTTMAVRCHLKIPSPMSQAEFCLQNKHHFINMGGYYGGKTQCAFWKDTDVSKAIRYSDIYFETYENSLMGFYSKIEVSFLSAMTYLNAFSCNHELVPREKYLQRIERTMSTLKHLSQICPANYLHKYLLLVAEKSRTDGMKMEAVQYFEQAKQAAVNSNFIQYEALANELVGKLWISLGMQKYAKTHIQEAYYLYNEWGSRLKVTQLRQRYPEYVSNVSHSLFEHSITKQLHLPLPSPKERANTTCSDEVTLPSPTSSSSDSIDLLTVMRASKTISMDLSLEQFLDNMMRLVIESSGAQRGVFLLAEGNSELLVVADGNAENVVVDTIRAVPLSLCSNCPQTIINYVARTKETVIMGDKNDQGQFENDPYIISHKIKSVLCAPIIKHNKFKGILYLDNNLLNHAFNEHRAKLIAILASQMAILLENAKFSQLLESEKKYRVIASELEIVKKRLEEYIDVLCHELRNPLNAILGNAQILQEAVLSVNMYADNTSCRESVHAITISAHHLKDIVDSVLNMSMIQNQSIKLQNILFQPSEVVQQIIYMFKGQLQGKSIQLNSQVSQELEGVVLRGDPYRFKEILINLISNSIKFTKDGHIRVSCSCADTTNQDCSTTLMVSVEDSGIGMSKSEQDRLFKPFSQASKNTFKEFGGSGLGLKICKDLVEAFGGSIDLESEKGKGTKFFFHIVLKKATEDEARGFNEQQSSLHLSLRSNRSPATPTTTDATIPIATKSNIRDENKKKILIVEDNPINSKLLFKILQLAGHECYTAANGMEAIDLVFKQFFNLVLMDIEMPVLGGLEATRTIRRREEESGLDPVPIIGVSANARQQFKEEANKSGMQAYITKPYLKQDIYKAVKEWAR